MPYTRTVMTLFLGMEGKQPECRVAPNVINLSLTVFFDTASGIRGLGLFSCLSGTASWAHSYYRIGPYAAITAMRGPVAKFPRKA